MNFAKLTEMAKKQRASEEEDITQATFYKSEEENEIYIPIEEQDDEPELLPDDGYKNVEKDDVYIEESIDELITRCFSDDETAYNIELERLMPFSEPIFSSNKDVSALKSSIGRVGITEPLLVRSIGNGEYEILSGNLRRKAAIELLWKKVPCRIADNLKLTDYDARRIVVESNRHRFSELKLSEKIRVAAILGETAENELSLTVEQIKLFEQLNQLEQDFLEMIDSNDISVSIGKKLSKFDVEKQRLILNVLGNHSELKLSAANVTEICTTDKKITEDLIVKILKPKPPVKVAVPAEIVAEYMDGKSSDELSELVTLAICKYFQK